MKNYEKIRNMSLEDMAKFLAAEQCENCEQNSICDSSDSYCNPDYNYKIYKNWLNATKWDLSNA